LWLILIPANYLIDRLVLHWSLGEMPDKGAFCRKHTWKICLAGFFSDLCGACVLLSVFMITTLAGESTALVSVFDQVEQGVAMDPFSSVAAFLVVALSVAVAGMVIYFIDRKILAKTGIDAETARRSALRLAVITAPYLYFVPSKLLY
jgi:hypothetical protein